MEILQYFNQNKIAVKTFMGINEPITPPMASSAVDYSCCLALIFMIFFVDCNEGRISFI